MLGGFDATFCFRRASSVVLFYTRSVHFLSTCFSLDFALTSLSLAFPSLWLSFLCYPAQIHIDTTVTRWHSTGLYLAPGEVATITVPAAVTSKGFSVRISGFVDDLSGKSSYLRMPSGISRAFPIASEATDFATPYGGPIYVDVGVDVAGVAAFDVTISGVVRWCPCPAIPCCRYNAVVCWQSLVC